MPTRANAKWAMGLSQRGLAAGEVRKSKLAVIVPLALLTITVAW
jgi:hypothetical protein